MTPTEQAVIDAAVEWRTDMENAPRDGTDVHVWFRGCLVPVPAYFISREYLQEEYGDPDHMEQGWYPSLAFPFDLPEIVLQPTAWQHLPPPPQEKDHD